MVTAAALRPSCFPVSVPRRAEPFPVSSLPNVAVRGGEQHLAALNGSGSLDEPVSAAQPARAGLVLISLIAVAAVANLNLSVANVALPSIGRAFDSSQTTLDLIAVGYSLGLAASVLYLGALGDRYGRKLMLILGMALSVPACLLAAYAPSDIVLFAARVLGGISAGMAYPTTLALIAALWSDQGAPNRLHCGRPLAAGLPRSDLLWPVRCSKSSGGGRSS
jgi:hypothetical protein